MDQMYLRNILFPRKSVTAIIGVGKELVREIEQFDNCNKNWGS